MNLSWMGSGIVCMEIAVKYQLSDYALYVFDLATAYKLKSEKE